MGIYGFLFGLRVELQPEMYIKCSFNPLLIIIVILRS